MTKIITLYGGPGVGKSTTSAHIFAELKQRQSSVELVREYVKKWAWQGRKISGYDEFYFVGKQIHEESTLFGKVDYIVTDKPLIMDIYYSQRYASKTIAKGIRAAVTSFYAAAAEDGHQHLHVFLTRSKPYDARGRYEDEATARQMDGEIRDMLIELSYVYTVMPTTPDAVRDYCDTLLGAAHTTTNSTSSI